jgi:hypothetical protein
MEAQLRSVWYVPLADRCGLTDRVKRYKQIVHCALQSDAMPFQCAEFILQWNLNMTRVVRLL